MVFSSHTTGSVRLLALGATVMVGAGCPPSGPRYLSDPNRYQGLPEDPVAMVKLADELTAEKNRSVRRTDRALAALELASKSKPPDPWAVWWRRARACFMMAEDLPNRHQKLGYSRLGRNAANRAVRLRADRVESVYYLALTTAMVAESENSMSLIKTMVSLGERAAKLDSSFDRAGPLRFLGKLYLTAPAWPVSVGSPEKAIDYLERAVELSPVPLNTLFLGQAYFHDEEYEDAARLIRKALEQGKSGGLHRRWLVEGEKYLRKACRKVTVPACSQGGPIGRRWLASTEREVIL